MEDVAQGQLDGVAGDAAPVALQVAVDGQLGDAEQAASESRAGSGRCSSRGVLRVAPVGRDLRRVLDQRDDQLGRSPARTRRRARPSPRPGAPGPSPASTTTTTASTPATHPAMMPSTKRDGPAAVSDGGDGDGSPGRHQQQQPPQERRATTAAARTATW